MVKSQTYACDWCERVERFDGDLAEEEAREAGWFYLLTPDAERTYCCVECLVAHL